MDYQHLTVQRDGPIGLVTFNRPDKANALNFDHLLEIESAAQSFTDDLDTRVVIFTGAGKHFSSGADLSDPGAAYQVPMALRRRRSRIGERAIQAILSMDQITLAAWNGAAMGGGACIATAVDFRIGADDCFMQYPEVDIGLNLMWKSLPLIVHLVGPARAKRLVAGGERIAAQTLLSWGVLDELVPRAELLRDATAFAERYAAKPPIAVQMIKQSVNHLVGALDSSIMHMDVDQNLYSASSEDRKAAVAAYLNGDQANFTGD
jgi:enoyl-CoA hydratase/carnithine racemase